MYGAGSCDASYVASPHLIAVAAEVSPADVPSHSSTVPIIRAHPPRMLCTATYPIGVPGGTFTDSHWSAKRREKQYVEYDPSIVFAAAYVAQYVELSSANCRSAIVSVDRDGVGGAGAGGGRSGGGNGGGDGAGGGFGGGGAGAGEGVFGCGEGGGGCTGGDGGRAAR